MALHQLFAERLASLDDRSRLRRPETGNALPFQKVDQPHDKGIVRRDDGKFDLILARERDDAIQFLCADGDAFRFRHAGVSRQRVNFIDQRGRRDRLDDRMFSPAPSDYHYFHVLPLLNGGITACR